MEKKSYIYIRTPDKEIIVRTIDKTGRKLVAVKTKFGISGRIVGQPSVKTA